MKRKDRKSYKKVAASLSALGAGALLGSIPAEAGVIYSGPVNQVVGFGPGTVSLYSSGPFGPSSTHFTFSAFSASHSGLHGRGIVASACGCLGFLTSSGFLKVFDKGALWPPPGSTYYKSSYARVAGRFWASFTVSGSPQTSHYVGGAAPFTDKYALFAFGTGSSSNTFYGWIHLALSITDAGGPDPLLGPNLTIINWAYSDVANQPIEANDVPEPATFIPTALSALALGAVGLRNWRKTRKAA